MEGHASVWEILMRYLLLMKSVVGRLDPKRVWISFVMLWIVAVLVILDMYEISSLGETTVVMLMDIFVKGWTVLQEIVNGV
jgi:hypothetical protein